MESEEYERYKERLKSAIKRQTFKFRQEKLEIQKDESLSEEEREEPFAIAFNAAAAIVRPMIDKLDEVQALQNKNHSDV